MLRLLVTNIIKPSAPGRSLARFWFFCKLAGDAAPPQPPFSHSWSFLCWHTSPPHRAGRLVSMENQLFPAPGSTLVAPGPAKAPAPHCTFPDISWDTRLLGHLCLGFLFRSFLLYLKTISTLHLPDVMKRQYQLEWGFKDQEPWPQMKVLQKLLSLVGAPFSVGKLSIKSVITKEPCHLSKC